MPLTQQADEKCPNNVIPMQRGIAFVRVGRCRERPLVRRFSLSLGCRGPQMYNRSRKQNPVRSHLVHLNTSMTRAEREVAEFPRPCPLLGAIEFLVSTSARVGA
jgi:hypothetical protein